MVWSLLLCTASSLDQCHAQFIDKTQIFDSLALSLTNPVASYGAGISFYDFNQDGWDDLTLGAGADNPVFLVNNEGTLDTIDLGITNPGEAMIQALLWADFNNDGNPDVFISKDNGTLELWLNSGDLNFTNIAADAGLNTGVYKHSNATFGDYNHDGCLDLYVSKYYNHNSINTPDYAGALYLNNCDGTFADVTQSSGAYLQPHHALQPVFTDINNDGWEDLFIAVDRISYPNELLINNQDGTFTRITESAGVDNHIDAMSASIADFNHNQLLDIYVTNNPIAPGNLLYQNNGDNTFTEIAEPMGVELMFSCWGALWIDFNNDTWEDLFVSRQSGQVPSLGNHFFINNSGISFTESGESMGINDVPSNTYVVAMGDLNNDGYYDLANGNRFPYTHRLFENVGGSNSFLSVTLEGTIANRDGIGTWIHCYSQGEHLVKFVHCGENLSGQNSRKNIFGLGTSTVVDSLVLEWNSGTREVYLQPDINTHHYFIEGASLTQPFEIGYTGDLLLCPGESTLLDAGENENYLWNTGDTTQTIVVSQPGTYSVEIWNEFGLSVTSFPVEVAVAPLAEITFDKTNVSCAGANDGAVEVTFSNGPVAEILWNTGDTATALEGLGPEVYSFSATDDFGCPAEGSVAIDEPSPLLALELVTDVLCFGEPTGTADLNIIGGTPPYTVNWWGENPEALHTGSYTATVSDMNGCNVDVAYTIEQPDPLVLEVLIEHASNGFANGSATLTVSGGTPTYSTSWSTGETDVLTIANLAAGNYSVSVTDGNNCAADTTFLVDTNTGIFNLKETHSPVLYPNPTTGQFRIADCPAPVVHLAVTNAVGRTIIHAHSISCGSPVSFDALSPGQYWVVLSDKSSRHFMRLVIIE